MWFFLEPRFRRKVTPSSSGKMLAVTSSWSTLFFLLANSTSIYPDDGGDAFLRNVGSYKHHGIAFQKAAFFIATAAKISNLA
jgi:hypothetical protein